MGIGLLFAAVCALCGVAVNRRLGAHWSLAPLSGLATMAVLTSWAARMAAPAMAGPAIVVVLAAAGAIILWRDAALLAKRSSREADEREAGASEYDESEFADSKTYRERVLAAAGAGGGVAVAAIESVAAQQLGERRFGALLNVERNTPLGECASKGTAMDAQGGGLASSPPRVDHTRWDEPRVDRVAIAILGLALVLPWLLLGLALAGIEAPISTHDGAFHVELIDHLRRGVPIDGWYPIGFHSSVAAILGLVPW